MRTLAWCSSTSRVSWFSTTIFQKPSTRLASMTFVRVKIFAPRFLASRAFRATSLLSSIQQSEYSKAFLNFFFRAFPAKFLLSEILDVPGKIFLPPKLSYKNSPSRISQAGRLPLAHGIKKLSSFEVGVEFSNLISELRGRTKRMGHEIWGIIFKSTSLSMRDSLTSRNSKYSK